MKNLLLLLSIGLLFNSCIELPDWPDMENSSDENLSDDIENKVEFNYEARDGEYKTFIVSSKGIRYELTALEDVEVKSYDGDDGIWISLPHHDNLFGIRAESINPVEYYNEEVEWDLERDLGRDITIINKEDDYILMTGNDDGVQYFELCGVKTVGDNPFHTIAVLTYEVDGSYKMVTEQDCMEVLEILRSMKEVK